MAQPGVVAPWRATYVPGEWYLIAGPTALVVLAPDGGRADMIADLWSDVVSSASMSDLVDRLAGYGITELPDLAVLFWSSAGMRTLVRGAVTVTDGNGGPPLATGAGIVTWNEVGLGELTRVRVALGNRAPGGDLLPLAVGVVRVGAVAVNSDEEAVVRSPQPLLRTAGRPAEPGADGAGPAAAVVGAAGAAGMAAATGADGALPAAEDPAGSPAGAEPSSTELPDDTGPDFPPVEADDADEPSQTGESPVVALNGPWGPESDDHPGAAAGPAAGAGVGGAGAAAAQAATSTAGAAGTAGAAAGVGAGAAVRGGEVSDPQFSLDQFAMENDDTQLVANPVVAGPSGGPGAGSGSASGGPMVEAVRCPNGHPNAPGSSVCRVCRTSIPPGPPQLVPLPLLARLRAADGTVVDLDRAILFGRAPSEQRSTAPLPRLVTLASPAQDISRTHLQVVPDNWQVVATDLNSTNGTYVTDPGPNGNSGLLPPGQPVPVPIGATMELGEGVTITVEPAE